MAAKKKEESEENGLQESQQILSNLLKANKDDHYNFEETLYYKVPSSSMIMSSDMEGGLEPGAHRFVGSPSGGKTSAALDFMFNFLKGGDSVTERKGVYFKCEGRLSPNMQARSGVTFVNNEKDWVDGTCIVIDSNIFEFVFETIRTLIRFNKSKCKFFFILDSLDMMIKKDDAEKPFGGTGSAQSVAGGALLTSVFFKTVSIALAKRGHIAILISQVRDQIKINQYEVVAKRQGQSNGGHAVEHAAGWVLDFQSRFKDDIIREGDEKKGKPLGHYAKCKIIKADNESYLREIRYPICYGRTGGNSIWREKEVLDMLQMWEMVARPEGKGQMYFLEESLAKELTEAGLPIEDKYRGISAVNKWLEANPEVVNFLGNKLLAIV
jgi:RecA/RadA recombinase